jgi:hypothetical protein
VYRADYIPGDMSDQYRALFNLQAHVNKSNHNSVAAGCLYYCRFRFISVEGASVGWKNIPFPTIHDN